MRSSAAAALVHLFTASLVAALAWPPACRADAPPAARTDATTGLYVVTVTSANRLATTVTDFGALGNNFVSRASSFEYPAGSGYEHMVHGGLWIGAIATDGAGTFTGVTTGGLDIGVGTPLAGATEFTPVSSSFTVRSALPAHPYYSPEALSEQDLISVFDDLTPKATGGNPETHRPMGLRVRQTTLGWSVTEFADVVFHRFAVTNVGAEPLQQLWVGLWTELASGDKDAYSCWPPSSGCGPGSWYSKKWLQWDGDLRMIREHYCTGPAPGSCNLGVVPYWAGVKLLTPPAAGQALTLAAWSWSPAHPARDTDVERHALMSAGTIQDLTAADLMPGSGDPVELLAIGPFTLVAPGDSVHVDFALVGGADVAAIRSHAEAAQEMFDRNYLLPLAAEMPAPRLALLGPFPNPSASGELALSVSLDGGEPGRIELFDIGGRRVAARDLESPAPGPRVVRWPGLPRLAAGVYVARLTQGTRAVSKPITILR